MKKGIENILRTLFRTCAVGYYTATLAMVMSCGGGSGDQGLVEDGDSPFEPGENAPPAEPGESGGPGPQGIPGIEGDPGQGCEPVELPDSCIQVDCGENGISDPICGCELSPTSPGCWNLECPNLSVLICEGKDGDKGEPGVPGDPGKDSTVPGQDGKPGQPGKDAVTCLTVILDLSKCEIVEECSDGTTNVVPVLGCEPGGPACDPADCDDGNPCTDDTCDPATGCVFTSNSASCDDGNPCTQDDSCAAGGCVGGSTLGCNDQNPCTDDVCTPAKGCEYKNNTVACDDGNACTTNDKCSGGVCVGGPALNCDDGSPYTEDSCDPAIGCTHAASLSCKTLKVKDGWQFIGAIGAPMSNGFPAGWDENLGQTVTWCKGEVAHLNVQQKPNQTGTDWVVGILEGSAPCKTAIETVDPATVFVGLLPSQVECSPTCNPQGWANYLCASP